MKYICDSKILKNYEKDILSFIHDYCHKHHIHYFLWGGTLLGAIRHGGFIPWDDDIDIAMPRKDYDFFMKNFKNKRYKAYSCEANSNYPYSYGKVSDTNTIKTEPIRSTLVLGIDVDVFPIDDFNERAFTKKNISKRKRLIFKRYWASYPNHIKFSFKEIIKTLISFSVRCFFGNANKISKQINRLAQGGKTINGDYMLYADSNIKTPLLIKRSWISDLVLHKFEDKEFYVPTGYDSLLRACYGDYLKLPPEEKRITHHGFDAYIKDCENFFK